LRTRQPFPGEPICTLDAIYFASVVAAQAAIVELKLLRLDDRVLKAGKELGLELIPP